MRAKSLLVRAALSVAGLAWSASGQNVLTKTDWSFDYPAGSNAFNFSGNAQGTVYPGGANGSNAVERSGATGTATQNFYIITPDQSRANFRTIGTQTFTLSQQSIVQIPFFFKGSISFFGAGTNDSAGFVTGGIDILNAGNTSVYSTGQSILQQAAQGNVGTNLFGSGSLTLAAGTYTVKASVEISARTAETGGGSSGTGVTVDWLTATNGTGTNIGAWPTGLTGSRAEVRAPQARTDFGVTGQGVDVGLIEIGRPYRDGDPVPAHPSLAGRLFLINTPASQDPNLRSEHSNAVASIIASQDADTENAGIAPNVTITTAALNSYPNAAGANRPFAKALAGLVANNIRVINMSATTYDPGTFGPGDPPQGSDPNGDAALVNQTLNANPNLVFVKSSGNNGGMVTAPGTAANGITVGAINRDFTKMVGFSSAGNTNAGLYRFKPDISAPGEYINAAGGFFNGFTRTFYGESFDATPSQPSTGRIAGTSFAAPHVTGAVALLQNYYDTHQADHDPDQRVMKAVLLNAANTNIKESDGLGNANWSQQTQGTATTADPLVVLRNLDFEIGAGKLDVYNSLRQYKPAEARVADNNALQHRSIDVTGQPIFWDHDTTLKQGGAPATPGTVDYLLGDVSGRLRATLCWNALDNGTIDNLEMRLYKEADVLNNPRGYDSDDQFIARTASRVMIGADTVDQNVGLFDFNVPAVMNPGPTQNPFAGQYYLSVYNPSTRDTVYGLAVMIPEPAMVAFVTLVVGFGLRRRGRRPLAAAL